MGICIVNGVKYLGGKVNWACMSDYHSTPFEQARRISAGLTLSNMSRFFLENFVHFSDAGAILANAIQFVIHDLRIQPIPN